MSRTCAPELDWQEAGGEPSISQCRGSMSQSLCNHDLQADADKRYKGDYGSRRTSLQWGLGICPLRCTRAGEWIYQFETFKLYKCIFYTLCNDINAVDAALSGGHGSRIAKAMHKNSSLKMSLHIQLDLHLWRFYRVSFAHMQLHLDSDFMSALCSNINLTMHFNIISHTCRLFRSSNGPILYRFTVTWSQKLGACTSPSCSMWSAGVT